MTGTFNFAMSLEGYRLAGYPKSTAYGHIANSGFKGVEATVFALCNTVPEVVDIDTVRDLTRQGVQLTQQFQIAGLEMVGLHWLLARTEGLHLTSPDAAVRGKTAEFLAAQAELTAALGGTVMVLGSPEQRRLGEGMSKEEGDRLASDVLQQVAPTLEKMDVRLAVEPLGPECDSGNYLECAAEAGRLIQMVGSEHVGLILDCKAMHTSTLETLSPATLIEGFADSLLHIHVNTPDKLSPGYGRIPYDFRNVLQGLADVGYDGYVSIETFRWKCGDMPNDPTIEKQAYGGLKFLEGVASTVEWPK